MQQLIELVLADRLAQHAKDHRAFVENDRLVGGRLIVERTGRARDRSGLFKGQRAFLLFALSCIESAGRQSRFAKSEGTPLGQTLRNPGIVKRLQANRLAPPLISDFTLELFLWYRARSNQTTSTLEK